MQRTPIARSHEPYVRAALLLAASAAAFATIACAGQSAVPSGLQPFETRQGQHAVISAQTAGYTERIIHSFQGSPDGAFPEAGLTRAPNGDLYGTTVSGGANTNCPGGSGTGCGTVYSVDPTGGLQIVYSFAGTPDGNGPFDPVLADAAGDLFGTTAAGGYSKPCIFFNTIGCGTVFEIDANGNESIIHDFAGYFGSGRADGEDPKGPLFANADGALFGATAFGGKGASGVVFEIRPTHVEHILHDFFGHGSDGRGSYGGLVRDAVGDFFGVTYQGGNNACIGGCGSVFELDSAGRLTTVHRFPGAAGGGNPYGGLVMDEIGDLFGTAQNYGDMTCQKKGGNPGCGLVFEIDRAGKFTILHTFRGGSDGATPSTPLIIDEHGDLYGTTTFGGDQSCNGGYSCGVVFKINAAGRETIVHTFSGGAADGEVPYGGLYRDGSGDLYGTTVSGGTGPCQQGCGVVYELVPGTRR